MPSYESALGFSSGNPHLSIERAKINLSWLHKMRWAALAGQLATIAVVYDWMQIEVPLDKLLAVLGLAAVSNIALAFWLRNRSFARLSWAGRGEWISGSLMMLDNLFLTVLLYYTGGPSNPFTVFYLVNIALAAAILPARWAWVLDVAAFLCFAFLFSAHVSLAALEHGHDHEHAMHHGTRTAPGPMSLHLQGSLIAFGGAATFIVYFITRISSELARREAELDDARQRKSQNDKLTALATLAAGAAHELASPLSTVAVLARDLELDLADSNLNEQAVHDVQLIRAEVNRCRRILDSMASGVGESVGEELVELSPADLLDSAFGELSATERIEIELPADVAARRCCVPRLALGQSLRALVQNSFDASPAGGHVRIIGDCQDPWLTLSIADSGAGMAEDTLRRAGEPFFTTKEPGSGMGLGLFLARRVIERLGGSLTLESTMGVGTRATIRLPLAPAAVLAS